jgi:hypothetical protein
MVFNCNLTRGGLLVSRANTTPLGTAALHQNDRFTLSLYFVEETGSATNQLTVVPIPTQFTRIALAARSADNLVEDFLLFSATDFTQIGTGEDLHYEAYLNLTTGGLEAKFPVDEPTKRALNALLDIELRSEDGTDRLTPVRQWLLTITRDIYRGIEGVPVDGDPVYPLPGSIALKAPTDGGYRINGVNLQLWNATQEIYQTVYLTGGAGAESLVIADEE